jgi:hypothetical protein
MKFLSFARIECTYQVLNRQIDLVTRVIGSSNLDAIRETGQGRVRPTASAVLRNVLVQGFGNVRPTVHVAPAKGLR